ncbi:MAG: PD-(D/E)XK nuclease family protein [Rothia sp. (in: high G+C Gram-positive bacteria)]|nr:PD-(D/E)XK nuclease family protein [Rothia sp. (in: high G+C Gram-positive bacteria)]
MSRQAAPYPRAQLILGAPGSGKTQSLLDQAVQALEGGMDPSRLLVLTPSRVSAGRFRQALSASITRTISTAPVRAWQAYAFDLLRRAQVAGYLPLVPYAPKLLSGPEQDVLIKELLEGHRRGEGKHIAWPQDLSLALETRGFRQEVRNFFDRMAEYDLSAQQVRALGQIHRRPDWLALADFYTEYRQVRSLRAPQAYDPAALIHEASKALEANPELLASERARYDLVLIDDVQELTPSIYRLLTLLVGRALPSGGQPWAGGLAAGELAESLAEAFQVYPATSISCCTDTLVQGFRGANPQLAADLSEIFAGQLDYLHLTESWRMRPLLAERWAALAAQLPLVPRAAHQRQLQPVDLPNPGPEGLPEQGEVAALLLRSPQEEAQLLAQLILEDKLYRGQSFDRSVIIVRTGSDVKRLKGSLSNLGLPVATGPAQIPVGQEPAVRPFLDALGLLIYLEQRQSRVSQQAEEERAGQLAEEGAEPVQAEPGQTKPGQAEANLESWGLGADVAISLLTSRLGGASSIEVRRLRQHLRAQELSQGGHRNSDALLLEALLNPLLLPDQKVGRAARRLAKVLSAGRRALKEAGATPETVLWALWEASGLADQWRETYFSSDPTADRAGRDLDAMIGLFEVAARYTEQMPGASSEQFLAYLEAQDLPMDSLASRGGSREVLEIMTPALAAGRQWDTVYLAGLQEGTWPNTTVRGSLLGTLDLIDAASGRLADRGPEAFLPGQAEGQLAAYSYLQRLKENRFDELRMFATASSRARYRVICTAVSSAEEAPSELLDIYAPAPEGQRPYSPVRRPRTLRSLVAELRQWSEAQHLSPLKADAAARLLHQLADPQQTAGRVLAGAHPSSWWGLLPLSSDQPTFNQEDPIPLSPSQLEKIHRSPLDWFVSAARAEAATDASRSLGTLVHSICEDFPEADGITLLGELEKRLPQLGLAQTWEGQQQVERAERMLLKFADYVRELKEKGRTLLGVEGSFSVLIPGPARDALLSGRVDRVEMDQLGRLVIIDIKTGKSKPRKADLEQHPQLAAYQLALEAGASEQIRADLQAQQSAAQKEARSNPPRFESLQELSGGALLLQLGGNTRSFSEQEQAPLSREDTWALDLVNRAAELIAGQYLQARHSSGGSFDQPCALPEICPLCSRGRSITYRPAQ